ncbi:MAG: molybdopterin-synthase adenylyltransferase MoeB [Paracoccus sp. (in: a-proteobacteria)]|nr:molybdopterin-synthase adenylyltransferase MoeB [Paracoccus sp. (in: a-proteobacteria)]
MLAFGAFAAVLAVAWVMEWPARRVALCFAMLWTAIVALHLVAPDSGLAARVGGSARAWGAIGLLGGAAAGYAALIRRLRARAVPVAAPDSVHDSAPDTLPDPAPQAPFSDAELDRYARHIVLREIGGAGQKRLKNARVLIVGAGGLGAPVALYLAAAGVGRITIADDDRVSLSNLQRQIIFRSDDAGAAKTEAAARAMAALNPHIRVTALNRQITEADAALIADHDLILDGTDNFAARAGVNAAAVAAKTPLIAGAIGQWEGQVTLFDPARGGPCMACLFPRPPAAGLAPSCAEAGVIGPLPGVVGALMALEAVKHLTGAGQGLGGRMLVFDGLYGETRMIHIKPDPDCPVCGPR